jgi:hypothetical protein
MEFHRHHIDEVGNIEGVGSAIEVVALGGSQYTQVVAAGTVQYSTRVLLSIRKFL